MNLLRWLQISFLLGLQGPGCRALPSREGASPSSVPSEGVRNELAGGGEGHPKSAGQSLKGRFLHITDIHPDPFYKVYSSTEDDHACHRGKGPAGFYGAETSDCDTPISLINATFKWIEENLKDEIDFIVWTGDSAKHDNDDRIPRTEKQVVSQNRFVVEKFAEVFGEGKHGHKGFSIPIVPTLGNNDVLPHNIFKEGPNKWTKTYLDIWKSFIPQDQKEEFRKGGYFSVEVIPNQLAVISLNTLYFFDSNVAVNGCVARSEPGYKHFEWLRRQLDTYRRRGMKVMLIGHVPPARVDSKADWVESCWQKYTLWQRQYRDIIVGSFYGHMNIDHFMLQDFKNIKKSVKKGLASARGFEETIKHEDEEELDIMSARDYLIDLRNSFSKIPSFKANKAEPSLDDLYYNDDEEDPAWFDLLAMIKKAKKKHGKKRNPLDKIGGEFGERYSLSFVAPSLVPNYFPTLRVFEYNITGLDAVDHTPDASAPAEHFEIASSKQMPLIAGKIRPADLKASGGVDEEKKLKHRFKVPKGPSKATLPGPAYSPQPLSLVKYTQYFANLTHINNDFANAMEDAVDDDDDQSEQEIDDDVSDERWKEGKHKGKTKKGKPHPRKFTFHVEYDTAKDKIHGLKDLTVRSYIDLARLIGDSEKRRSNKSWHAFIQRAFVSAFDPEDLENQFGGWNVSTSPLAPVSGEEKVDDGASFEL